MEKSISWAYLYSHRPFIVETVVARQGGRLNQSQSVFCGHGRGKAVVDTTGSEAPAPAAAAKAHIAARGVHVVNLAETQTLPLIGTAVRSIQLRHSPFREPSRGGRAVPQAGSGRYGSTPGSGRGVHPHNDCKSRHKVGAGEAPIHAKGRLSEA